MDLRNYLERIYKVPVAAVRTRVQHGACGAPTTLRPRPHRSGGLLAGPSLPTGQSGAEPGVGVGGPTAALPTPCSPLPRLPREPAGKVLSSSFP